MSAEKRLTIDRLDDRGCLNLLYALCRSMSKEFRIVYREYLLDPADNKASEQYVKIRDEFESDYFSDLTKLDGKDIVKKLEAIIRNDVRKERGIGCCA